MLKVAILLFIIKSNTFVKKLFFYIYQNLEKVLKSHPDGIGVIQYYNVHQQLDGRSYKRLMSILKNDVMFSCIRPVPDDYSKL